MRLQWPIQALRLSGQMGPFRKQQSVSTGACPNQVHVVSALQITFGAPKLWRNQSEALHLSIPSGRAGMARWWDAVAHFNQPLVDSQRRVINTRGDIVHRASLWVIRMTAVQHNNNLMMLRRPMRRRQHD
eukprot:jgi/Botrbrau1/1761/Bobra.0217s0016.1